MGTSGFGTNTKAPAAIKPLCEFRDYQGKTGKAISAMMELREIGKYYKPAPKAHFTDHGWDSTGPSKYVPMRINGYDDAMEAINKFVFPADIRSEAARAARHLVGVFEKVSSPTIIRNLTQGRVDRRKVSDIAQTTAMGRYNPSVLMPFRKIMSAPSKVPTIAIVADANFAHMWSDAEYIPRMLTITVGILWACEAVGLHSYAALCYGHMRPDRSAGYSEAMWTTLFSSPTRTVPLKLYATLMHRDMFRWTLIAAEAADLNCNKRFNEIQGTRTSQCGTTWSSRDGGYAVKWAREILGADAVVAIGNVLDRSDAEVQLGYDFSITDAVKEIAKQDKRLRHEV